ncbi:BREX-1 system phosphatase PglZ type B [Desulfobulbus alkaliphilus]|uniref:BREX-1 system phosphatase PglZ type B n=1 Tax=Desulfobulbus alkaliphilus TaxID=869814 RepID=UPI0019641525|nr:BREX-1 system phosphatase PglZ type B [Desulfobulbus alkaliphilus]MBM9537890.1 BREX-1 system phosphatase PglZ type B [Desulfobulbus alkaliphilus]
MRVLDHLLKSIRDAAVFNPEVQVAPACILWPDRDRQWEAVIPVLQAELPELMILGDYAPEKRIGPAIWLRCVLAKTVVHENHEKHKNDKNKCSCLSCLSWTPILYLPGVSRQDLRAVESCPDHLKPLAELQYRGVIWSQINGKDWTILAYLKSDQGGLGLDVAQDNDAKNAMQLALYRLLDEDVSLLKGKRLDKDYFNTLLTGGDPIRDLLQWLDQGDAFQAGRGENEWKAFVEVCKSQLAFNPLNEGVLAGCTKLANHEGPWHAVWERYREAPKRYPNIPAQIRKCRPPSDTIFWHMGDRSFDGWPQWNDDQEKNLQRDLIALAKVPAHEARAKVEKLEKQHGRRRSLVWVELGDAPLACALQHLTTIAENTQTGLAAGSQDDLAAGYRNHGWRVDDGVVRALAEVDSVQDFEAVKVAIRSLYLPWVEESARYLQKIWVHQKHERRENENCILFVDGLRFDCAKRLGESLEAAGCEVEESVAWAALPSVTGTCKPAVAPLDCQSHRVAEEPAGFNFEPMSAYQLSKAIEENGYYIPDKKLSCSFVSFVDKKIWLEFGDIDHEGHDRGWKLAKHIDALILEITDCITELLAAGWKRVRVVTDHGWLLLPGGLPKIELPRALTDSKWGRCASLKPGAVAEERLYPWFWNPNQYFALADGVSCFRKGEEYSHGGLSLQECLTLHLTVTRDESVNSAVPVEVTDVVWKGLRCTVAVDGNFSGLSFDVRSQAGNSLSSVVVGSKPLKDNGTASVVVEDEDMEGREATVVLIDTNGALVAQIATIIGGTTDGHR